MPIRPAPTMPGTPPTIPAPAAAAAGATAAPAGGGEGEGGAGLRGGGLAAALASRESSSSATFGSISAKAQFGGQAKFEKRGVQWRAFGGGRFAAA